MKKLLFILCLVIGTTAAAQWQPNRIGFNQDEDFKAVFYIDPTFTDAGEQYGAGIRKDLEWGWVGVEASVYPELAVSYWDLIGQGGLVLNVNRLDVYGGFRLGRTEREGNPYPLVGMIMLFEYNITKSIAVGVRFWVDHREDQKDEFYGDSSSYKPGIIFKGELAQENGAFNLTIKIN